MPADVDPGSLAPGRMVAGRYRLTGPIARGGMAEVWSGHDDVLARPVAVKVLHGHLARDEGVRRRFRREAVTAARLAHPNVVATFDTGIDGDLAFIVMELVPGRTLRDLLAARGPLPPVVALSIADQIADALGAAHRAGLVHRDIKPANVLVADEDGSAIRIKVTDFGIAKAAEEVGGDLTITGTVIGTPKYLSPEQVEGREPDARADLYALGVVLFEMLTGRPPFEGPTQMATALSHLRDEAPRVSARRPGLPVALDGVVADLLSKEPAARPGSAALVRASLAAAAATIAGRGDAGGPAFPEARRPPAAGDLSAVASADLSAADVWPAVTAIRGPVGAPDLAPDLVPDLSGTTVVTTSAGSAPASSAVTPPYGTPAGPGPVTRAAVDAPPRPGPLPGSPLEPPPAPLRPPPAPLRPPAPGAGVPSTPPTPPVTVRQPNRHRARRWAPGIVVLALVAAGGVVAAVLLTRAGGGRGVQAGGAPTPPARVAPVTAVAARVVVAPGHTPDDAAMAGNVLDGSTTSFWQTDVYRSSHFGNLYPGIGLALQLSATRAARSMTVTSTSTGWTAQAYSGTSAPPTAGLVVPSTVYGPPTDSTTATATTTTLSLGGRRARWVLLWFTSTGGPPYQVTIDRVTVN